MRYGNLVIVGHNYRNEQFFGNLKNLTKGDKVFLFSANGDAKTYKVYDTYIINEKDMSCTSQETNGQVELTLITCDSDNTKRLVVKCRISD